VYLSIILSAMLANLFDIGNAASELHVESVSGIAEPMPYRCPASSFNQRNNQGRLRGGMDVTDIE